MLPPEFGSQFSNPDDHEHNFFDAVNAASEIVNNRKMERDAQQLLAQANEIAEDASIMHDVLDPNVQLDSQYVIDLYSIQKIPLDLAKKTLLKNLDEINQTLENWRPKRKSDLGARKLLEQEKQTILRFLQQVE